MGFRSSICQNVESISLQIIFVNRTDFVRDVLTRFRHDLSLNLYILLYRYVYTIYGAIVFMNVPKGMQFYIVLYRYECTIYGAIVVMNAPKGMQYFC